MRRFICIILLITATTLQALANDQKRILIISPFPPENAWWQTVVTSIEEIDQERHDIQMYSSKLSSYDYNDEEEFHNLLNGAKELFSEQRPDLIILYGTTSYPAIYDFNEVWPGVPTIIVGELDYICPLEYQFTNNYQLDIKRETLTGLQNQFNMTYIQTPIYVDETVDLMKQMLPNIKKMMYIKGEEVLGKELEPLFKSSAESKGLLFNTYSANDHTTIDLEYDLSQIDRTVIGVVYTNFLSRTNVGNTVKLKKGIRDMIEDIVPHICPYFENPNVDDALGFVSYDLNRFNEELRNVVLSIIDDNHQPKDIKPIVIPAQKPVINYKTLETFGIDKSLIPSDAIVANQPVTFWQEYKSQIFIYAFVFILIILAILVMINIKDRKRKKNLIIAKDKAEKSDKSKTKFVQNMSHEIRTPLNAIVGFSQLLSLPPEATTQEEREMYAQYISNSSNMLMMLVDDILNLAEGETGNYKIELSDTSCNEICKSAIKNVEYRLPQSVKLIFKSDVEDSYTINTDGRRIQQILINYLTNACKHTVKGEIRVICSTTENPGKVTFAVEDTGTGIPEEMQGDIFERFTKHDSLVQGTGLGLNICRTVARKLGGEVKLDNEYKNGARFLFII